jgi:hypothetical protein
MSPHMFLQIARVVKSLWAMRALARLLSRMNFHVLTQHAGSRVRLFTHGTTEGLLSGMQPHMLL